MSEVPGAGHESGEARNSATEEFTVLAAGYGRRPGGLPDLDGLQLTFPEPVTDKPAAYQWFRDAAQRHKNLLDAYLALLHSLDGDTTDVRVIEAADDLHHSVTELMIGHGRYAGAGFPSSEDNARLNEQRGALAGGEYGFGGGDGGGGGYDEDEEWDPNAVDAAPDDEIYDLARTEATELPVTIALNQIVMESDTRVLRLRTLTVNSDGFMVHLDEMCRASPGESASAWEARRMELYEVGPGSFTATRADGSGLDVTIGGGEHNENEHAFAAESLYWIAGELDGNPITVRLQRADLGPDGCCFEVDGAALAEARSRVRSF